ncbi:LiaI-LiaF-like domain-containing protein [Neobacillus sp. OS1-32]|uniref:LiaI-LiaF-like domain-containing protein n=1 Tax=Neobacillus sp. OS1-32 TaxID=3070682 RepID=UPI0035A63485
MKNQRIFPGIILIGLGAYYLLQQAGVSFFQPFSTWPILMIIVGTAFLGQGYWANDSEAILPGFILFRLWPSFSACRKIGFLA